MAESLRDLVVSLSLNTDNFTRNIKSVNKQIQEAESYFRLASAGIRDFESSPAGFAAKGETLTRKLSLQRDAVGQYERALEAAKNKLTECYTRQEDYSQRLVEAKERQATLRDELDRATQTYEHYRDTLGETDSATIAAQSNMEAARQEYQQSCEEVQKLSGQCDALRKSTQNAADTVSTAQTQLNRAQAAVRETEAAIRENNAQLRTAQSAWRAAGEALTDFSKRCDSISKTAITAGRRMTTLITTPIVALGTTAVKASLDFESSFASVRKTVDATEEEFGRLAASSKEMSTKVAASTSEINEVMATGGQLGIANDHLEEFSKVMIDLGNSCEDLDANDAATSIAKFANVMKTDQALFQNIGSTIVDLGNNFATTERPIMEMAQRLAGAGKQVGLTEAQVLGFAAALSSVGIEAQMGGSSFSKALIKMEVACATGGEALDQFAAICGMSSQQFKTLFESDPAAAFQSFIVGLSQLDEEGESAIAVLNEIGISEVRLRDTLLRSVNATELFERAQQRANQAWNENTALTVEANKRYATTESKLTNLKNKAMLFAQQLGDDLNPTIQNLISGAEGLIGKLMDMDATQRQQIIQWAAIAAAAGPALLVFGKITKGVGTVAGGLGKFATAVGNAGGGFGGFLSVLGKSPSVWLAVAAGVTIGTIALVDFVSGAREAREALKGMEETAKSWKDTAAETFYNQSGGLSFFGMSNDDFVRTSQDAQKWKDGLIAIWTDGEKESDEIVSTWTNSFKSLTASTREALEELKTTADENGYGSVSGQIAADIETLDAMDAEIERLLKKRQNGYLTEGEKIRLQDLIDAREAIEIKYHLSSADTDGFDTIRQKLEAEVARAQARGLSDADVTVYENALVAAAEGMAAVNSAIDAQYDKEYAVIQLMEDEAERQQAQAALDAKYRADRLAAAQEYAATMAGIITPVWEQENIRKAADDVEKLTQKLREYSVAADSEKPALLTDLNELTASMDESSLVEYIGLLTQIQSLMDSGMSQSDVQNLFPEVDFSTALDQLASIQQFLNTHKWDSNFDSIGSMFGEALPEEMITLTTDLDMTGAQARWDAFAANPGAITTDAIIADIQEQENAERQKVLVDGVIDKYTVKPEGADTASLSPEGLIAYVSTYAEATSGADVSGLTPENVTAIVSAYNELAAGADVSTLKPDEIVAYVQKYLEGEGVDTTGLTPEALTATVMAYEEVSGGALTTSLTPDDITAMVVKYLEADGVDISALKPDQIEALVNSFSEATGCDKSGLLTSLTGTVTEYKEASGVTPPTINAKVAITGYDLIALQAFKANNPVEVNGIVRLGEVFDDPSKAKEAENVKFYDGNGVEIPVTAVPTEMLTADKVAVLDGDGTMHVMITPQISGSREAVENMRETYQEVDQLGLTAIGKAVAASAGVYETTLSGFVKAANQRIETAQGQLDHWWNFIMGGNSGILSVLDQSMQIDFNAENLSELSTYVGEVVAAIKNGEEISVEDAQNLQDIVTLLKGLDTTGVGDNVKQGVAEGMTAGGWDADAETVAAALEAALNSAFISHSPAQRMVPIGQNVSAGVGQGAGQYDFSGDAGTIASALEGALIAAIGEGTFNSVGTTAMSGLALAMSGYSFSATGSTVASAVQSAMSASLTTSTLRSIGVNAMAGLAAGIRAGTSSVTSAMRSAAQAAVRAAKSALVIRSPSHVFRDEVGIMTMARFTQPVRSSKVSSSGISRFGFIVSCLNWTRSQFTPGTFFMICSTIC